MLDFYLSPEHRDNFGFEYLLPALAADITRQSESVKGAFTDSLKQNMTRIANYMPARDAKNKLKQAMMIVSGMAGAVLILHAQSKTRN